MSPNKPLSLAGCAPDKRNCMMAPMRGGRLSMHAGLITGLLLVGVGPALAEQATVTVTPTLFDTITRYLGAN